MCTKFLNLLKDEDKHKNLDTDNVRPIIRFGLRKAKAILAHVDDIRNFVDDMESSPKPEETDERQEENH